MFDETPFDEGTGETSFKDLVDALELLIGKWNNAKADTKQFTADEVQSILITTGQSDTKKFKLGELIRYSPSEVFEILRKKASEDE